MFINIYNIKYNFKKFKEIDPFEEENWDETESILIEYRIFYYKNNSKFILIGEYYNNNRINILSNSNNNISFLNNDYEFDFDDVYNNYKSTSNLVNKIISGKIKLTLASNTKEKYSFNYIKKYLNPKIKINFI